MQTATNSVPAAKARPRNAQGHYIKQGAGNASAAAPSRSITTAPRALDPTPPVLSLFRHGPLAVLRIHDLAFSGVVSSVVQSLPADVESLVLVTPTDTKMFAVNAGGNTHAGRLDVPNVTEVPPAGDATMGAEDDDPQAEAIREAAEGDREVAAAGLEEAEAAVNAASTASDRRKALTDLRRATESPASDPCGRCGGTGAMNVALPDGGASQAPCAVCRGSGTIRRFGVRSGGRH